MLTEKDVQSRLFKDPGKHVDGHLTDYIDEKTIHTVTALTLHFVFLITFDDYITKNNLSPGSMGFTRISFPMAIPWKKLPTGIRAKTVSPFL